MRELTEIVDDIHLAEASAWLARLKGSERSDMVEEAFRTWLSESRAHARAYARVADVWDIIPGAIQLDHGQTVAAAPPRQPRWRMPLAAAACGTLILVVAAVAWLQWRTPVYQTAAGGMEVVTLHDGTRVALNTDTRLSVDYGEHERRIRLERGEAIFEDVADPKRPFVVQAGEHQVRALGTTFQVRIDPERVAVTLMDGRVAVSRSIAAGGRAKAAAPTILSPGERLILRTDGHATLDHPSIKALTAWRRGEAVFDDVPLAYAVDEINRYGGTPVRLGDPALAQMRVSGVFAVHDPVEFANALAKLHHLRVVRSGKAITIVR
ncbi:MAG: FecR family protein [Rhodanobacteraceae bacterium]